MLDAVSICVQYDLDGVDIFSGDDLRHRQNNGRYENTFSKRSQRCSRQKQRGAPLGDHTLRIETLARAHIRRACEPLGQNATPSAARISSS
jgi:hypothetical protein